MTIERLLRLTEITDKLFLIILTARRKRLSILLAEVDMHPKVRDDVMTVILILVYLLCVVAFAYLYMYRTEVGALLFFLS